MKILYLDGEVNSEMVHNLTSFINENPDQPKKIYFNSVGGDFELIVPIYTIINENKDDITLYLTGSVMSSAFIISYFCECEKVVLDWCVGMLHRGSIETTIDFDRRVKHSPESIRLYKQQEDYFINKIKQKLTKTQLKKFKDGKDVYFDFKELKYVMC